MQELKVLFQDAKIKRGICRRLPEYIVVVWELGEKDAQEKTRR
jgi:hypothetical protein